LLLAGRKPSETRIRPQHSLLLLHWNRPVLVEPVAQVPGRRVARPRIRRTGICRVPPGCGIAGPRPLHRPPRPHLVLRRVPRSGSLRPRGPRPWRGKVRCGMRSRPAVLLAASPGARQTRKRQSRRSPRRAPHRSRTVSSSHFSRVPHRAQAVETPRQKPCRQLN